MTKIYVGNLPFSATDAEIRELFAQHGTVESVSIITDRDTGRRAASGSSRCHAPMHRAPSRGLNGKELGGRPLRVNEAQERTGGGRRQTAAAHPSAGKASRLPRPVVRACEGVGDRPFHYVKSASSASE